MSEPPRRRRPVAFRPRFTLMLLYLLGFFLAFAMLFALPSLLEAAWELPPGPAELSPAELERARDLARSSLVGRVPLALAAAVVATGLGIYAQVLPGMRGS